MVSVVIPAYNAARYLGQALDSLLAQNVQDWEAIVVDDGSADSTLEVARTYSQADSRIRFMAQPNSGPSAARNRGIGAVSPSSDAVAFLDADDLWEPDALDTLLDALRKTPGAVGAHALARYVDTDGRPTREGELEAWGRARRGIADGRVAEWPLDCPTSLAVLVYSGCFTVGTVVVRRDALEAASGFDASLRSGEDYDLWLRLAVMGDFAFVDKVVMSYRRHPSNSSRQVRLMSAADWTVRRKLLESGSLTPQQRQLVLVGHRRWQRDLCVSRLRWAGGNLRQGHVLQAANQLRHAVQGGVRYLRAALSR